MRPKVKPRIAVVAVPFLAIIAIFVGAMHLHFTDDDNGFGGGDSRVVSGCNCIPVVVAAEDIPAGTEIKEGMLIVASMRGELVVAGAFRSTESIVGQTMRVAIAKGEQIIRNVGPPVPEWRGVGIPRGLGAVSLGIEPLTVEGEPVSVSDRVDILIEPDGGGSATTLLAGVEVISAGSMTVTLALEPEQAQLLTKGWPDGTIRLRRSN